MDRQANPTRVARFDTSHQAQFIEPEETGVELLNLPQTNQPSTTATKVPEPNPNSNSNSIGGIWTKTLLSVQRDLQRRTTQSPEEDNATNLEDYDPSNDDGD
jgi:hypothetical protein